MKRKLIFMIVVAALTFVSEAATNAVEKVQCFAQTQSGTRCKRRAVPNERYCRQHSSSAAPKKAPDKCRSFTADGKPCESKPVDGKNYCEKHLK